MAMSDEVREQHQKMKNATPWQKFCYFFHYYKWHTIVAVVLIFVLVITIYQTITGRREKLLYGVFINASPDGDVIQFQQDVGELFDINWKKQQIVFNTGVPFDAENWDEETYYASSLLTALITMQDLDFISCQETEFLHFSDHAFFQSLDKCLPEDVQELVQDYYYYYTDENGETYPLGIKLDDCSIFEDYGIYEKHETILGIIDNSERIDNTVEFIRYIFHQSGIQ